MLSWVPFHVFTETRYYARQQVRGSSRALAVLDFRTDGLVCVEYASLYHCKRAPHNLNALALSNMEVIQQ